MQRAIEDGGGADLSVVVGSLSFGDRCDDVPDAVADFVKVTVPSVGERHIEGNREAHDADHGVRNEVPDDGKKSRDERDGDERFRERQMHAEGRQNADEVDRGECGVDERDGPSTAGGIAYGSRSRRTMQSTAADCQQASEDPSPEWAAGIA